MLRKVKPLRFIKNPLALSMLSAAILTLPFLNGHLGIVAWFGFLPLFYALEKRTKSGAFLLSFLSGFVFWLVTIYWLVHVTLIGMVILSLYLAIYFGIFGFIFSAYQLRARSYELLFFIPAIWVILEYIRGYLLTGFPWALLGYSQYLYLPFIQIADITGAWGVSFLVMTVNVAVYIIIRQKQQVKSIPFFYQISAVLVLLVSLGYGLYKLQITHDRQRRTLKISVIQGNIPQELKWDIRARDFIINKFFYLSEQAIKDRPDLIIWPESALPCILEEEPSYFEKIRSFTDKTKIPLLLGAVTKREDSYYNNALFVSGEGQMLDRYAKLHLVPFGEYIPLRKTLRFLETIVPIGDFTAGKKYTVFQMPRLSGLPAGKSQDSFAVLICFEDLFPELSRQFVIEKADFLVNITNDAWFGKTTSPYQHLQASVFRAVENRVFLARCANTGVSGFIAPSGKIISLVHDEAGREIFIDGYRTAEFSITKQGLTFYTRYGDFFVVCCFLWGLYGIISPFKKER
jgi:apolipoprotein N-acyltransferase